MIRLAKTDDIDSINNIYNHIHDAETEGNRTIGWVKGVYPTRQTAEDALSRGDLFVMEEDGKIVASAIINHNQMPEYADCSWKYPAEGEEVMVLHTLVVDPEESGHAYGKTFVNFYEAFAIDNGCRVLRIDTQEKNQNARRFYAKLGFTESGIVGCEFNGIPDVKLVCLEKSLPYIEYGEFKERFSTLGENSKAAEVDKFCRLLIRERKDLSFLKPLLALHEEYYRLYFQVSIGLCDSLDDKFAFIEENFELLHDWWHVDGLMVFLGNRLTFEYALEKAKKYVIDERPYVRRFGYVMFIPRLMKKSEEVRQLLQLFHNDDVHHVVMGEAWLLSYVAMCDADLAYDFIRDCDLKYNIVGKAIQKICDSYVITSEDKERFKGLRAARKAIGRDI